MGYCLKKHSSYLGPFGKECYLWSRLKVIHKTYMYLSVISFEGKPLFRGHFSWSQGCPPTWAFLPINEERGSSVYISVNCNCVISIVSQTTGFFNRAILWQSELMQCKLYFSDLCYLISIICKLHWLLSSWISPWFIGLVAGLGLGTLAEVAKRQLGLGKTGT